MSESAWKDAFSVSGQFYIRKSACVRVFMGRSDPDSESLQCSGIYWGWWDCSVFCELQCDNSLFLLVKVFILFVFLTCDSGFHPCPLKHFPQVCTQSWTSHCWTPGVLMTLFRYRASWVNLQRPRLASSSNAHWILFSQDSVMEQALTWLPREVDKHLFNNVIGTQPHVEGVAALENDLNN